MKKVNFFKVMSACVAFAAVTFTSCSEEEMTLTGPDVVIPEMPESPVIPATASVSVSVYSVSSDVTSNGILLAVESIDATANIGKEMTVDCPAIDGYIVAPSVTVAIPELKDGQAVVVPVSFYVANEGTAAAAILSQLDPANAKVEKLELIKADDQKELYQNPNESIMKKIDIKYAEHYYYEGVKYLGKYEAPDSKAATGFDFVDATFKACEKINTWTKKDWDFSNIFTWINPYHQTTTTVEQAGQKEVYTISFNGEEYEIALERAGVATWTMSAHTIIPEYEHEWSHLHSHGHAGHDWLHGNSSNAGGGINEAE